MSLFRKIRYGTVLTRTLPWGIACFFGGLYFFSQEPNLKELHRFKGEVFNYGKSDVYSSYSRRQKITFYIEIKRDSVMNSYYTYITSRKKKLNEIIRKNQIATVWTKFESNEIEQIEIDGKLIIKYRKPFFVFGFFIVLGALTIVASVGYLITQRKFLNTN